MPRRVRRPEGVAAQPEQAGHRAARRARRTGATLRGAAHARRRRGQQLCHLRAAQRVGGRAVGKGAHELAERGGGGEADGVALRALHDRWGGDLGHAAIVHVDDRAATSGVSRFGEEMRGSGWTYDKRDGLLDFDAFDYRLAELPLAGDAADFDVLAEVYTYAGLKPDEAFPFLKMETAPAIAILRHKRHRGVRVPEPLRISA